MKKISMVGVRLGRDTKKEALYTQKRYQKQGYKVRITKSKGKGYWVNIVGKRKRR